MIFNIPMLFVIKSALFFFIPGCGHAGQTLGTNLGRPGVFVLQSNFGTMFWKSILTYKRI
jgi:hypothetical protein